MAVSFDDIDRRPSRLCPRGRRNLALLEISKSRVYSKPIARIIILLRLVMGAKWYKLQQLHDTYESQNIIKSLSQISRGKFSLTAVGKFGIRLSKRQLPNNICVSIDTVLRLRIARSTFSASVDSEPQPCL